MKRGVVQWDSKFLVDAQVTSLLSVASGQWPAPRFIYVKRP